jgi:hypothetical protein
LKKAERDWKEKKEKIFGGENTDNYAPYGGAHALCLNFEKSCVIADYIRVIPQRITSVSFRGGGGAGGGAGGVDDGCRTF